MAPTMAIATTSVPLRAQSRERRPAVLGSFGGRPRRVRFTAVAAATAVAASSACAITRRGRVRRRRARRDGRRHGRQPVREPGGGRVVGHVAPLDAAPGERIDRASAPASAAAIGGGSTTNGGAALVGGPWTPRPSRPRSARPTAHRRARPTASAAIGGAAVSVVVRSRVHGLAAGSGFAHRSGAGVGLAAVDRDASEASPKQAPDHRRDDDRQEHASDQCDRLERHHTLVGLGCPARSYSATAEPHRPAPLGRADAVSLPYAGCAQTAAGASMTDPAPAGRPLRYAGYRSYRYLEPRPRLPGLRPRGGGGPGPAVHVVAVSDAEEARTWRLLATHPAISLHDHLEVYPVEPRRGRRLGPRRPPVHGLRGPGAVRASPPRSRTSATGPRRSRARAAGSGRTSSTTSASATPTGRTRTSSCGPRRSRRHRTTRSRPGRSRSSARSRPRRRSRTSSTGSTSCTASASGCSASPTASPTRSGPAAARRPTAG